MAEYYATPSAGTGHAGTEGDPFRPVDFAGLPPSAGDILWLNDGTYTDADDMLDHLEWGINGTVSGSAGNTIKVCAINEGDVLIDGGGTKRCIFVYQNDYWEFVGINVTNGGTGSNKMNVQFSSSDNCILRRCISYDHTDGQYTLIQLTSTDGCLIEDCAAFGQTEKCMTNSQNGDATTFRRCFSMSLGGVVNSQQPVNTMSIGYNATDGLMENCIMMWDLANDQSQLVAMMKMGENTSIDNNSTQLGNLIILRDGDGFPPAELIGVSYTGGGTLKDNVAYIEPGSNTGVEGWSLTDPTHSSPAANSFTYNTGVATAAAVSESGWDAVSSNNHYGSTLSAVFGAGDLYTGNPDGDGARIRYRYEDGTLTSTPLWPWPMNQRIIDAMTDAGDTAIDVNSEVQGIFGNFPSEENDGVAFYIRG